MKQGLKTDLHILLLGSIALFVATCTDAPVSGPFDIGDPLFDISDGANGGNEDVFFLPPLVGNPEGHPDFGDRPLNPDLEGSVFAKVCTLDGNSVMPPPTCVDMPGDIADLPMTLNGDHYHVVWNAKGSVDAKKYYRIHIFIGGLDIAHRDVDPGKGGSCTDNDPFCTFNNNAPIKVRIESAAACIALDPTFDATQPCATATLTPGDDLVLQEDGDKIGVASLANGTAAINMQLCTDLRDRGSIEEGRVDLQTFGDCVVIDALDLDAQVDGTATVCQAFEAGQVAGLSDEQIARSTVHRFSTDPGFEGTFALPHADFEDACNTSAPLQGRLIDEFTGTEQFARMLRRTWWTVADQVRTWVEPAALWARPPVPCHRGGCAGSSPFRSDFQAALPAGVDFYPDPVGPSGPFSRDFGDRLIGDVIENVSVQAWDSGECDGVAGCMVESDPVNNVRLTVSVAGNSKVRGSTMDPFASSAEIITGPDGIASFDIEVGAGLSTIDVGGIGVAVGKGNVQSPSLGGGTEVLLSDNEVLQFTVEGFHYTISQGSGPEYGVTPVSTGETVQGFYNYGAEGAQASSTTSLGLERTDISILFLFEGPEQLEEGTGDPVLSLVMIHDIRAPAGDGSGGTATFNYQGMPGGASYVVRDDNSEPLPDGQDLNTTPSVWRWNQFNTDGGAVSPLGMGFEIELTPLFPAEGGLTPGFIKEWKFLSGTNGADVTDLDKTTPITIRGAGSL